MVFIVYTFVIGLYDIFIVVALWHIRGHLLEEELEHKLFFIFSRAQPGKPPDVQDPPNEQGLGPKEIVLEDEPDTEITISEMNWKPARFLSRLYAIQEAVEPQIFPAEHWRDPVRSASQ